jgi:hypothetical protein
LLLLLLATSPSHFAGEGYYEKDSYEKDGYKYDE